MIGIILLGISGFSFWVVYLQVPALKLRWYEINRATTEMTKLDREQYLAMVEEATERWPNFKSLKKQGDLQWVLAVSSETKDEAIDYFEAAATAYSEASRLHPWELSLKVNAGRAYDQLSLYDTAEPYYLQAFENRGRDEFWIHTRYELANHYFVRAKHVWYQRQPEQALAYFSMARELLKDRPSKKNNKLFIEVNKNINFLRATGIKESNHTSN